MRREDRVHDLLVIGGGSAGLTAAGFGAALGADVLLVEENRVGGDCTWTGCIPSKALLHEAAFAVRLREAGASVDFARVMARVRTAVDRVYAFETPETLAAQGIQVVFGRARFRDAGSLDVDGRQVHARRFVICTGARPSAPPVPGLDSVRALSYEHIFDLDRLPDRLVVVGGGPVGVELAQSFQRLGSSVTILESGNRLLPAADPAAANLLARRLAHEGVRIETGVRIEAAGSADGTVSLSTSRGGFEGDSLLVATGRRPNIQGLDLDRAGVTFDSGGITVDAKLRTTRADIYAAGDVTGGPQFTHYAGWQGYVAARNALLPGASRGLADAVPWAVFTDPEIAQVGLTEVEARERGLEVSVLQMPAERIDRAQTMGEVDGFIKLLAAKSGRVVGATAVGPEAAAAINEISVAMAAGVTLAKLAGALHVYPTLGIAVQQLASRFAMRTARSGLRGAVLELATRGLGDSKPAR